MRWVKRAGDWAGYIGSTILVLSLSMVWTPYVDVSFTAVMIGVGFVLLKGVLAMVVWTK